MEEAHKKTDGRNAIHDYQQNNKLVCPPYTKQITSPYPCRCMTESRYTLPVERAKVQAALTFSRYID